jgi:penicillin amidase
MGSTDALSAHCGDAHRSWQAMQQDTVSLPARAFQKVLQTWNPKMQGEEENARAKLLRWDCNVSMQSFPALLYEIWIERIHDAVLPPDLASGRLAPDIVLQELNRRPDRDAVLDNTLRQSMSLIRERLGPDRTRWIWGNLHHVNFQHESHAESFALRSHNRPGDGYTVNATGGANFNQTHGASYREILDTSDWDRSVMTNVPGESGVPGSKHYADLIEGWASGTYHPLPYSRKAVEAATEERITLLPIP